MLVLLNFLKTHVIFQLIDLLILKVVGDLVSSYASQDTLIKSVTNVQVVERMLSGSQ